LLRSIARRNLQPGDFLGTEAELGEKHGVSRVTVRQALRLLERDGYLSREKAKGTFIKKAVQRRRSRNSVRGTVVLACSNEQALHADEDLAFAAVVMAVEQGLTKRGFISQILSFGTDANADRKRLRELSKNDELEGICTIGPCLDPYLVLLPDVPIVTSCTFGPDSKRWVGSDTQAACRTLIDHLICNGHRDIALICSSELHPTAFGLFAVAYSKSFEAAGLTCPRHLLYYSYPGESLRNLVQQILSGPIRPTALFAENWKACQTILTVAAELGVRIPEDVSIVAFGRNVLQIAFPLAITAYVPDYEQIGEKAVELLTKVLSGDGPSSQQLEISGTLVERDSVRRIGASFTRR
jgi:LacI family transcriptional regulator